MYFYNFYTELYHHGVKGMKWGVWNEETRKRYSDHYHPNGVISKGSLVARVSRKSDNPFHKHDPLSGKIKYVSTNQADHGSWIDYFQKAGYKDLAGIMYSTTKDIKVASATKAGKEYVKMISNDKELAKEANEMYKSGFFNKKAMGFNENESFTEAMNNKDHDEVTKNSLRQVMALNAIRLEDSNQYKSGKKLVDRLSDIGYDAVEDAMGWNVAIDPLIIFNPRKNLTVEYDQRNS